MAPAIPVVSTALFQAQQCILSKKIRELHLLSVFRHTTKARHILMYYTGYEVSDLLLFTAIRKMQPIDQGQ